MTSRETRFSNMARGFENVCEITSKSLAGAVYIEDITWWREDMNFIFSWQKQYFFDYIDKKTSIK